MMRTETPISTYRIQFTPQFRFVDCRDLVPYLHELGVGAVYSSPRFRANRGSSHGYDVANPARINSELGSDEEFDDLCLRLRHYGMGLILDIVPNHMTATQENEWWMDVLEHGPSSARAHYFDIDWHPATAKASFLQEGRVLLPILGDLYGNVLESGDLSIRLDERGFFLQYYERRLPLDPSSYEAIFGFCSADLEEALGTTHEFVQELSRLRAQLRDLPPRSAAGTGQIALRMGLTAEVKRRVFEFYRERLDVRLALDEALRRLSGYTGAARSFDRLHDILERQAYRLAYWKIAFEEINYRRFFDINDLVCLRVEEEDVFQARQETILRLVEEGKVLGLRVDHVDGLYDPGQYLQRLRDATAMARPGPTVYTVVEKILGRDELQPEDWQADGTTGYDFLNVLNDVFVEPEGLQALDTAYSKFTGETRPFAEICYASNKQVMWKLFAGEVQAFGHRMGRLAAQDRQSRDVPLSELLSAFVEMTACLPVYRTYLSSPDISPSDRSILEQTLRLARSRTSEVQIGSPAFEFLRRVLLLDPPSYAPELKDDYLSFVMHWQQFTGPVMAKGLEDTAGYVYNSLISRNDVGGDALRERPPRDVDEFHAFHQCRLEKWPYSMSTTSTHDTKRSEDVRARLNVLSELAPEWEKRLLRWNRWNQSRKSIHLGVPVPTPKEEVLLYQTMLGVWPLDAGELPGLKDRLKSFAVKATREAKVHSGWISPDEIHENAVLQFLEGLMDDDPSNRFRRDFLQFQEKIAPYGAVNSLAQVLIKTTAPGVPDFYQGSELWDWSLVDPDNRRPVDFGKRVTLLEELRMQEARGRCALLTDLVQHWRDGRIKLFLTDKALDYRRQRAELFLDGSYLPLAASGARARHIISFARQKGAAWALTATPRWIAQAGWPANIGKWGTLWENTVIVLPEDAPRQWRNVLTGEVLDVSLDGKCPVLPAGNVFARFPVALLDAVS